MNRVLLFAGTTEGRSLAGFLESCGVPVLACVATEYGESLMEEGILRTVRSGRLGQEEMESLMKEEEFSFAVDATHPYAALVSENIRKACAASGTEYLRLYREEEQTEGAYIRAESVEEAVSFLAGTRGNILVTTGSKELEKFTVLPDFTHRVYARVLSTEESVSHCVKLGLQGSHLISMQGPFGEDLNTAILRHVDARWLVTKESGKAGGFAEKQRSAAKAGAGLVVITRPKEKQEAECESRGLGEESVRRILCERLGVSPRRMIDLIGIGMGGPGSMTGEAMEACRKAELLVGASRMIKSAPVCAKPTFASYRPEEIRDYLLAHPEYARVGVLLSGDVGFYSGAGRLLETLKGEEVRLHPGISSAVYLCARRKVSWEDGKLLSLHGRSQNLIAAVQSTRKVFALAGRGEEIKKICEKLQTYGLGEVTVTVGERLSYPEERISTGKPGELLHQSFDDLCAVLIENPAAVSRRVHGLRDEDFVRGKVPMTKAEVRSISISRLELSRDAVAYDVGAGTGSLAVEMALQAWDGQVYAIEKKPEAVELILQNQKKFGADNLTVVEGLAPEALRDLPAPTHVFVGGSSGNLREILETVLEKNPKARIVINAIALETVAETLGCLKNLPLTDQEICTVSAARAREIGRYHMMTGQNPVYIISCTGGKADE